MNENHNGLIRQYLPKGMELDKVADEKVSLIQNKLNNRPRKLLDYKTPNEVYEAMRLAASLHGVALMAEIRVGIRNHL
ncbi:MAG: IS30 family transposase [Endozoicomonadaceae bacterium]|nr:IS30 family transposase [Endozoicomonadaceae bacterium]